MKIKLGIASLSILLSGCTTKIIREYYTNPESVIYVEQPVQKVIEANPIPIWAVVIITFIVSFILFMLIDAYIKRIRKSNK